MESSLCKVIGHRIQNSYLDLLTSLDRVPSGLLLIGPSSVGKRLSAKVWMLKQLCETQDCCGTCHSCRLFLSQNHPDVFLLEKDGREILVEDIRQIKEFAYKSAYYGKRKFVLIDDAEAMNDVAANAFLKVLEEPPGDTVFVLVGSRMERLLPTIRSRCVVLRFFPLAADEIASVRRAVDKDKIYEGSVAPLVEEDRDVLANLFERSISQIKGRPIMIKDRSRLSLELRKMAICLHDVLVCLLKLKDLGYNVVSDRGWSNLDQWILAAERFFDMAAYGDVLNLSLYEAEMASLIRLVRL